MLNIQPASGRHSIKSVLLAVEWPGPIEPPVIEEISRLHDRFRNDLPRRIQQNAVTISISGPDQIPPVPPALLPQISGVMFDRLKPNGEAEWALNVQLNMAVVICNAYDRWNEVKARSLRYLSVILPVVLRHQPASIVSLQYTDEFVATGDVDELRFEHVFREGSRYVAGNAQNVQDLWHSHHGYFERLEHPLPFRRLTNINVSVASRGNDRVIQILTAHKGILNQPTNSEDRLLGEGGVVGVMLEGMHDLNKQILRDLLNDRQRAQISLV